MPYGFYALLFTVDRFIADIMANTDKKAIRRSKLLMPADSLEKLKVAVLYGADAIYMGTPDMSLRTKSSFTLDEVVESIEFVHAHGKRAYLTLNIFIHNKDISKISEYLETVKKMEPDGLIIADPGEMMQLEKDERSAYILNSHDLCLMPKLDAYMSIGVNSLKV